MGTAFTKNRRNSQNLADNSRARDNKKSANNNNGNNYNVEYNQSEGQTLHKKKRRSDIKATHTGSSSSSVTNQQHPPYLENKLNPNNTEINTGLVTASVIPSNSKSTSSLSKIATHEPSRNNTTDKHLNTLSMHKLLTFGWIRQHCLTQNLVQNVPTNIFEACFEFIYIEHILFCFIASENEKISTIQAIDTNNIYKSRYQLPKDHDIGDDTNGICVYSQKNMTFPTFVTEKYKLDTVHNRYHTIFKCGSQNSRHTKCVIIPQSQFQYKTYHKTNALEAYIWELPPIPSAIASYGNTVSYSDKYGLITIGGTQPDSFLGAGSYSGVLQLKWHENSSYGNSKDMEDEKQSDLRWKALRRMNTGRAHASSTFFIDDDGMENLFICGGDLNGSVEVYSFQNNAWKDVANTNVSRECGGIYYDNFENTIYLGGGHGAQRKIECYDIYRNEWTCFPNTKCKHDFYPSLFKPSYHYDILYIISPKSNLCEYIDKREGKWNNGKWDILYDHELHDKIFKIPDEVDFEQFRFIR